MAEKVSIELTVEQAQAVRGWLANNQAIVQNTDSLKKLEEASEKAAKKSKDGFDQAGLSIGGVVKGLGGWLAGMASITTAMQLFNREVEAVQRKNQAALNQQVDLATAQRRAFDAAAGGDLGEAELEEMLRTRSRVGLKESTLAAEAAMKEAGLDFSKRRAVETALAAGEMAPHLAAEGKLPGLAAAAVDLQKQQEGLTERQSLAQLMRLGRFSESRPDEIAKELIPAVARGRALTGGKTEAGTLEAFFLTLQDRMDVGVGEAVSSGEMFLKQLATRGKPGASLEELLADKSALEKSTAAVRSPKALATLRELAAGGKAMTDFQSLAAQLRGSPEEVLAEEEERAARITGLPSQQAAEVQRRITTGVERFRSQPGRALAALESQELRGLLTESGTFETEAQFEGFLKTLAPSQQLGALGERLRSRRQEIEQRTINAPIGGAAMGPAVMTTRELTAEERDTVAILKEVEARLADLVEIQKNQHATPQKIELPPDVQPKTAPLGALND